MKSNRRTVAFLVFALGSVFGQSAGAQQQPIVLHPGKTEYPIKVDLSPPLRSIPPDTTQPGGEVRERENAVPEPAASLGPGPADQVAQRSFGPGQMPGLDISFDGVGVNGFLPPDTTGDVGPDHYIQWVNVQFAIYNKRTGQRLYGPTNANVLWNGFGGPCQTRNDGDPLAMYDSLANRWVMSQFTTASPYQLCFAVSETADPLGRWYRYQYHYDNTFLPDYPKIGLWPDAYYMSANEAQGGSLTGAGGILAFDRSRMLRGEPGATVFFRVPSPRNQFLPSHLTGDPPPAGAPNYFMRYDSTTQNRLELWKFNVDFEKPANSTFTGPTLISVALFRGRLCNNSRNCLPQPETTQGLDSISNRLLYRLQYRNFGDHEALVVNHTVDDTGGSDHAAIRWYEVRDPNGTPSLFQQGTYAPDSGHRWMGSIAMDNSGNIALGYSVTSSSVFPSIRYTGRLVDDPPGELPQGEALLIEGSGSQLHEAARWGDYSTMSLDPSDQCTFWYTNEYLLVTSRAQWRTRVGAFRFPSCASPTRGTLEGTVTDGATAIPAAIVTAGIYSTTTDASGRYSMSLPPGTYNMTASKLGYSTVVANGVVVIANETTTQNFLLALANPSVVSGTVRDGSGHVWPLYARIDISAPSFIGATIFTNPATGAYSIQLVEGVTYTFAVTAVSAGYTRATALVTPAPGGTRQDFDLLADLTGCNAPGYAFSGTGVFEAFSSGSLPPGGWNVVNNLAGGYFWRFNDPNNRGNRTGGSGGFAIMDFGALVQRADTELRSPNLNFASLTTVPLEFDTDFVYLGGERVSVDVSADSGLTWTTVWERTEDYQGPHHEVLDISSIAARQPNVIVRFYYFTPNTNRRWWEIDNVRIGTFACTPRTGGLVVGTVRDANTGLGLNGANLRILPNAPLTQSFATGDPVERDGFYLVFQPPVQISLTAQLLPLYADNTHVVNVIANNTVRRDFDMRAGRLSVSPNYLRMRVNPAGAGSLALTLTNTGTATAGWTLQHVGPMPWLRENPFSGAIAPSGNQISNVTFDSAGLLPGTRFGRLNVQHSTPYPVPDIPVDFTIRFLDVADEDPMANFIYGVAGAGILYDHLCGGLNFCPNGLMDRALMAVWLLQAKEGSSYTPPPATGIFLDVPPDSFGAAFIEELFRRGVTAGCGGGNYCPNAPVSRGSMAVLLLVTREGAGYRPPPAVGLFLDVPAAHPLAPWIEEIFRRGVSAGCGGGNFCPDAGTTRGQEAVFVVKTFGIPYLQ